MATLSGAVALVTGASSGIGEGIAKMLSAEGVKVVLVARRENELQRVAEEIRRQGGTALTAPADVRDEHALRTIVAQTEQTLGPIDILVNSAGTVYAAPIHATAMQQWDTTMEVNLRAPLVLCTAVLPSMRERMQGFIINIASEAGAFIYGGMGAYAVSKHALRVVTELIQQENQELGIKTWAICPGVVSTPTGIDFVGKDSANFLTVDEITTVVRLLLTQGENVKMGPEILIRTMRNPFS